MKRCKWTLVQFNYRVNAKGLSSKPKRRSDPTTWSELKWCSPTIQLKSRQHSRKRWRRLADVEHWGGLTNRPAEGNICHHFLPESRIWLWMTSPTKDGNACQLLFSWAGVRKSPLGGFGIYVLFNLKCCDLCGNLFLFSLIFALLTDPSAGFRISACAPARTVSAFFFFFFKKITWCCPWPPCKPLLLHLINISGCTLLYPPCSHLLMCLAPWWLHFMSRICWCPGENTKTNNKPKTLGSLQGSTAVH